MKEEAKNILLTKLANGSISNEEYRLLEIEALEDDFLFEAIQGYVQSDENHQISALQERIYVKSKNSTSNKVKTRSLWRYTSAVAAFLILISLGIWTYNFNASSSSESKETYIVQAKKQEDQTNTERKQSEIKSKAKKTIIPQKLEYSRPAFEEISESKETPIVHKKEDDVEPQVQATSQYDEEGVYDVVINENEDRSLEGKVVSNNDRQIQEKSEKIMPIPKVNTSAVAQIEEKREVKNNSRRFRSKYSPQTSKDVNTRKVYFKDEDGVSIEGQIINSKTGQIIDVKAESDGIELQNKDQEFIFYNPQKGVQEKIIYKDQNQVQLTSFSWKENLIYFPKIGWDAFYQMIDKNRKDAPFKGKVNIMIHINKRGSIELIEVLNDSSSELSEFTKAIINSQKDWIVLPNKSSFQFPLQVIW